MLNMKRGGKGKEALTMTVSYVSTKMVPILTSFLNSPLWTILCGFTSKNLALWCGVLDALTGFLFLSFSDDFNTGEWLLYEVRSTEFLPSLIYLC
jgi:hypothetical protein